jgi:hypothetical protein
MKTTTLSKSAANGRLPLGVPPEPEIDIGWQWISPEDAATLLARNFDRNRNIRAPWVTHLANLMSEGGFFASHQGIAFDPDDNLIDGQHRLNAIIKSGIGQWFLVATGVPREAVLGMDVHARRMDSEQIRVATDDLTPSRRDVAIARFMNACTESAILRSSLSGEKLCEFLRRHREAIAFPQRHSTGSRTSAAPIEAAIAKSYYRHPHERLVEFMEILHSGIASNPADLAPATLHKWVHKDAKLNRGGVARVEVYLRTCSAIMAFMARRPVSFIRPLKEDPFPLPKD